MSIPSSERHDPAHWLCPAAMTSSAPGFADPTFIAAVEMRGRREPQRNHGSGSVARDLPRLVAAGSASNESAAKTALLGQCASLPETLPEQCVYNGRPFSKLST